LVVSDVEVFCLQFSLESVESVEPVFLVGLHEARLLLVDLKGFFEVCLQFFEVFVSLVDDLQVVVELGLEVIVELM